MLVDNEKSTWIQLIQTEPPSNADVRYCPTNKLERDVHWGRLLLFCPAYNKDNFMEHLKTWDGFVAAASFCKYESEIYHNTHTAYIECDDRDLPRIKNLVRDAGARPTKFKYEREQEESNRLVQMAIHPITTDNIVSIQDIEKTPSAYLQSEIDLISEALTRQFLIACVTSYLPVASWQKPSSHDHHPADERGIWGNLRHTKRVVKIAQLLSQAEKLSEHEHDLLIAASIIHDTGKYGVDGKSAKIQDNHPELIRLMIPKELIVGDIDEILSIVETHMGQWGNIQPITKLQKLCHYADYIASRDDINIPMTLTTDSQIKGG